MSIVGGFKLPFEYSRGYGYSPAAGPPVGAPALPITDFFGDPLGPILPKSSFSFGGRKRRSRRKKKKESSNFGVNLRTFPQLGAFPGEVGPGIQPGGEGGPAGTWIYGGPSVLGYWPNFGVTEKSEAELRALGLMYANYLQYAKDAYDEKKRNWWTMRAQSIKNAYPKIPKIELDLDDQDDYADNYMGFGKTKRSRKKKKTTRRRRSRKRCKAHQKRSRKTGRCRNFRKKKRRSRKR